LNVLVVDGIRWTGAPVTGDGVLERSFRLGRSSCGVPGVLWLPTSAESRPSLVLLGRGGGGHKRSDRVLRLARWFAAHANIAALAIDGPYHGDRVRAPLSAQEYQARMVADGVDVVAERMVSDWQEAVNCIAALGVVDTIGLGYVGLSMGTRFGVPFAAAAGSQLRCAVLGKFGLQQTSAVHVGLQSGGRIRTDAPRVTAPVLFHVQRDDELFPMDGQLALFDRLGSSDKQLIAYPGRHGETSATAIAAWRCFVVRHLVTSDRPYGVHPEHQPLALAEG